MIVEKLRPGAATDLKEEDEDLQKRFSRPIKSTSYRLSFFRTNIPNTGALRDIPPKDVLGYAIIKRDKHRFAKSRVYESVIRSNEHRNNFVRGSQTWQFAVAGVPFQIDGYLYAQQNGFTNCCAHVALRTAAARFHRSGDMSYREMNNIMQIDHVHCRLGPRGNCDGVKVEQMVQVLEAAGARCNAADYQKRRRIPLPPYQKYVYSSIESGYPAIILFGTPNDVGHAIPVFGHTFNQDIWVPHAEQFYFESGRRTGYTPSDSWLSSFICHDDNLGSNLCIPRHYLRIHSSKKKEKSPNLGADHVASVLATMPWDVKLSSIRAEALAFECLAPILATLPVEGNVWVDRLRAALNAGRAILRTIMCSGIQYADHLARVRDWQYNKVIAQNISDIKRTGLHTYWLVEVSIPDLFSSNKRKVGEILITADVSSSSARDFKNFALARLPGYYTLYSGRTSEDEVQLKYVPCALESHIELFGSEEI